MSVIPELLDERNHGPQALRLRLSREWYSERCTIGRLTIDGQDWNCFTLEDSVRLDGVKVPGKTAIAAGTYGIVLTKSPRLKYLCPELLKVPNFTGVRIHIGNTETDTEGCILVGDHADVEHGFIGNSKAAFQELMAILEKHKGPVEIEITDNLA